MRKETINEMFEFLRKSIPNSVEFNIATPYPGTRFYDYAIKNGWMDENIDWHMLYQDVAFYKNRELSNDYFDVTRKKLYYSVYLNPRWFFKNLFYLLKNPDDFVLASRYLIKIIKESMNSFNIVGDKE